MGYKVANGPALVHTLQKTDDLIVVVCLGVPLTAKVVGVCLRDVRDILFRQAELLVYVAGLNLQVLKKPLHQRFWGNRGWAHPRRPTPNPVRLRALFFGKTRSRPFTGNAPLSFEVVDL